MEATLATIFSTVILAMTIFTIVKALNIAYKRDEITIRKFIVIASSSVMVGIALSFLLFYTYQNLFDYFL